MGVNDKDNVKVIMATAFDDAKSVIQSYQEGTASCLIKPITQ